MKKLKIVFLFTIFISIISFSFMLSGCASKNTKKILPPQVYYKKALYEAKNKNYSAAAKNLKSLITNYPSYRNTRKAELKLGDIYYLAGKYIEAVGAYTDFLVLHPRSKEAPFAMFYIGMSHYKRIMGVGRSQNQAKKAKAEFEKLISKYPYSTFSKEALKLIKIINIHLSKNTFFTGLYYFNAGMWKQAAYMYKIVLKQYKGYPIVPKDLYYLYMCYSNLKNKTKANKYKEILISHFPESIYSKRIA
jgi:outer membrane protein assembly factor BamD